MGRVWVVLFGFWSVLLALSIPVVAVLGFLYTVVTLGSPGADKVVWNYFGAIGVLAYPSVAYFGIKFGWFRKPREFKWLLVPILPVMVWAFGFMMLEWRCSGKLNCKPVVIEDVAPSDSEEGP